MASAAGRIFDGKSWSDVRVGSSSSLFRGSQRPVPPVLDGDGKIHVAISSFRGSLEYRLRDIHGHVLFLLLQDLLLRQIIS
jgi:hypothetical protein